MGYDKKGSSHLKLIDFGFSERCVTGRLSEAVGTLVYVAPEVLNHSYTSQADMWSLGVVGFILLTGEIPFSGATEDVQIRRIKQGQYRVEPEKWDRISAEGQDFIRSLLEVDPTKRLSAQKALEHPWIAMAPVKKREGMSEVVNALQ